MHTLELDLYVRYCPPMLKRTGGVVFTRTLELPFVPHAGLSVFSESIDDCPAPMGYELSDVVWDMDRGVFLASAAIVHEAPLFTEIVEDIRDRIALGWRLGSATDACEEGPAEPAAPPRIAGAWPPYEDDGLHLRPPKGRPREFNRLFRALVRFMAETNNNVAVAYAMDTLGLHPESEYEDYKESPVHRAWRQARDGFEHLSIEEQSRWRDKVRRYPRLHRLIESAES